VIVHIHRQPILEPLRFQVKRESPLQGLRNPGRMAPGAGLVPPPYHLETTISVSTDLRQTVETLDGLHFAGLSDVSKLTLCETKWGFRLEVSENPVSRAFRPIHQNV